MLLEQVDLYTLPLLGVTPLLGRWFQPDEVIVQGNTSQTIVISYGMWQRVFGGAPDVIGKKMPGFTAIGMAMRRLSTCSSERWGSCC